MQEMEQAEAPVATEKPPISSAGVIASAHETSVAAVAAQAKANVEARFLVALNRPRDMDTVRMRLLKECLRPSFAEVAIYSKPVGKQRIQGPSIRFAEAAVRMLGNIQVESPTIYEDEHKRIVRVSVTDLESNATYSQDITVDKTIERRHPRKGQEVLGTRENTSGQMVYIVKANEDELQNKTAAGISKVIRNQALRILPGDIKDECVAQVGETLRRQDAEDPDASRKRLLDAFAGLSIEPGELRDYLGHDVGQSSHAELGELRNIFAAIRDGETTWAAVKESREEEMREAASGDAPTGNGRAAKAKEVAKQRATESTGKKST